MAKNGKHYGAAGLGNPDDSVRELGPGGGKRRPHKWPDTSTSSHPGRETHIPFASGDPIHDPVEHPSHYTSDPSGVECIQITRHRNFNIGNAIKYLWRAGLKNQNAEIEDLRKAVFYIVDEIDRLEGR